MRRTLPAILAVAFLFLMQQSAAHAQLSSKNYGGFGTFAQTSFTANNSNVMLFVGKCAPSSTCYGSTNTFIVWFGFNDDGSATEGDGVIPDTAFQSTTLQHMSLNVDTSQVPGFSTQTCTFVSGVFTCTNGPFGVMQADWESTDQFSYSNKEDTQSTMGPFTTNIHNDQKYTSAAATGSFMGTAFSDNSNAQMGTNKEHDVTITKPQ